MNDPKLARLLNAARQVEPMAVPPGFADDMARLARATTPPRPADESIQEWLVAWAPRIVLASLAVIAVGVCAELVPSADRFPSIAEGVATLSAQWLFTQVGV